MVNQQLKWYEPLTIIIPEVTCRSLLGRAKWNTKSKNNGKSDEKSDSSYHASLWAKASPLGKSAKMGPPSGSMGTPDDMEEEVVEKKAKCKTNTKNNKHPDKEPKQGNNTWNHIRINCQICCQLPTVNANYIVSVVSFSLVV